jgi:hypothetical protein
MKNRNNLIVTILFILTFIIHFILWKFIFHLDEVIIIKFYLFLTIIFILLITLIQIIYRNAAEYLGLSFIGIILLKFLLMFFIKNKLHFEVIPNYKYHFILPYLVLTALLTYYAIGLIKYDKKQ